MHEPFARGLSWSLGGPLGSRRQQHLALDVDEQRRHVNELRGHVHVQVLQVLHVAQILRRNLGDGNVINVDVLLADKVQQEIEGTVIDRADTHGEREFVRLRLGGLGDFCH